MEDVFSRLKSEALQSHPVMKKWPAGWAEYVGDVNIYMSGNYRMLIYIVGGIYDNICIS